MRLKLGLLAAILLLIFISRLYGVISAPDIQCTTSHITTLSAPQNPKTSLDFFNLGNYNYDIGNCKEAIANYTRAIELDPKNPQAYNNRAYTNMRLRNYQDALTDLNKAISIKPDYVEALMNRGDIHNYYYQIDRKAAIADYAKVISLGKEKDKSNSVCGHKYMAQTNNFIPLVFLKMLTNTDGC